VENLRGLRVCGASSPGYTHTFVYSLSPLCPNSHAVRLAAIKNMHIHTRSNSFVFFVTHAADGRPTAVKRAGGG
jgi:hypothetical protein